MIDKGTAERRESLWLRLSRRRWPEALGVASLLLFLTSLGYHRLAGPAVSSPARREGAAAKTTRSGPNPFFRDVSREAGINYYWTLDKDMGLDILQSTGNGCALLDYDNDGNLDVLLIGPKLALYKGDGHGHFKDVTHATGLDRLHGHFIGCAVGDYDNDGYDDLYITAYQGGVLLHNEHGKFFTDVTRKMGLTPQPFGTSAAFGDVDGDGRLDLYICNYCIDQHLLHNGYKNTSVFGAPPLYGTLWKNRGDRFENVTASWRAARGVVHGKALAVCMADYDGSGHPAIAIANDTQPNDLLAYAGHGVRNVAERAGVARGLDNLRHDGTNADSGMGVDWGDYDNDGRLDMVVTTYETEPKNLYHNEGDGLFSNQAFTSGVTQAMVHDISWGVKFLDYDNDGLLDLVITSGHVNNKPPDMNPAIDRFRQKPHLLHNRDGKTFEDVSDMAGPGFDPPIMGRGLAIGDFDNDGRMDVLLVDIDGRAELLRNETPRVGHWLLCKLVGTKSNRDGFGAMLTFETPDGRKMLRYCHADGSYLSASDKRVHCGLGQATEATITVKWPSGHIDIYRNVRADRVVKLTEGQ